MTSLSTRFFGHPRLMNPIFICGGWGRTLRFGSARNFPAEAAWHGSAGRPCFDLFGAWIRQRPRALRYTVPAQHTVQRPTLPGPRQECRPTRRLSPAQPQHSTRLQLGPCVWALSHMSPFCCGQWPERWQQSLRGPTGRLPFPRHLRTLGSSMRQAQSDSHWHGGVARCKRQSSIAAGPLLESATLPRRRRYLSIGRAK